MIKRFERKVWAFDAEWVPDPVSGRLAYGLGEAPPDEEVVDEMWRRGGAIAENPRPYLKTVLCRVVSIAAVCRHQMDGGRVEVSLVSAPSAADPGMGEAELIGRFLAGLGKHRPQLVGFNSCAADVPILMQRAMAHGLAAREFCERPAKPWEGIDYFAKHSDWHIDLRDVLGAWGKSAPSLHEMASVCGIPGKLDTSGSDVVDLWRAGDVRRIVQYNECDALTTYLVWLRLAHLCGHFTQAQYLEEQRFVEELMRSRIDAGDNEHLERFLEAWRTMRAVRDTARLAVGEG